MIRVAILVDGGFYRRRAVYHWGKKSARDRAKELYNYCLFHAKDKYLYRIFYYDCPPYDRTCTHPLTGAQIDFQKVASYQWTIDFYNCLKRKRKLALRLGKLEERKGTFRIKNDTVKALLSKKREFSSLVEDDFELDIGQKGVDMRIGLDISSLSYKKQVDQIILISGDSDFVPASKHARREGVDFILDPMGQKVNEDLFEHVDGVKSFWKAFKEKEVVPVSPDNFQTHEI